MPVPTVSNSLSLDKLDATSSRHHFTRFDQVDQLVGASEADAELAFMHRLMALCSLPRTDPGDQKEYVRRNGPYKLGRNRCRVRGPLVFFETCSVFSLCDDRT